MCLYSHAVCISCLIRDYEKVATLSHIPYTYNEIATNSSHAFTALCLVLLEFFTFLFSDVVWPAVIQCCNHINDEVCLASLTMLHALLSIPNCSLLSRLLPLSSWQQKYQHTPPVHRNRLEQTVKRYACALRVCHHSMFLCSCFHCSSATYQFLYPVFYQQESNEKISSIEYTCT